MHKFKVGDRVVLVEAGYSHDREYEGQIFTITKLHSGNWYRTDRNYDNTGEIIYLNDKDDNLILAVPEINEQKLRKLLE